MVAIAVVFAVLFGGTLAALAADAVDPYEPDNTWATATAIATDGSLQTHRIDPASDVDWVKFTAQAGRPYRVTLDSNPTGDPIYDANLYLYDSDGTTVLDYDTSYSDKSVDGTADANETLKGAFNVADLNDGDKLGRGK